jgi:hypothetical protein
MKYGIQPPRREDFYDYQPGNATRYYIYARPTIDWEGEDAIAFFWLREGDTGGRGMVLKRNLSLHLAYFMEKSQIKNECDCVALLCFLGEAFGVKIEGIPMGYRGYQWFLDAEARGAV